MTEAIPKRVGPPPKSLKIRAVINRYLVRGDWRFKYLQMPEEEGEDEPHSDAHDPSDDHEGEQAQVRHGLEDGVEFWHGAQLLRKHLRLLGHALQGVLLISRTLRLGE